MHAVVFGRVLEGLEIVDKLQNIATDRSGRPGQKVVSLLVLVFLNTACASNCLVMASIRLVCNWPKWMQQHLNLKSDGCVSRNKNIHMPPGTGHTVAECELDMGACIVGITTKG
jgi:hypothetical protein